jgi:DMSO/TMAO reductase YedYZ molybdopterin-dependent catalytic subunit
VRLADILERAAPRPEARALEFESFDGAYTETLTLDQARRDDVMVAYELDGKPISSAHGGPVRLYVAPMYGYKSLKWLQRITLVAEPRPGYWEKQGYDVDAWIGRSNGRSDEPA